MQIQFPLLGKFEFGRPQFFAAMMLLLLAVQAVIFAVRQPGNSEEASWFRTIMLPASSVADSILLHRAERAVLRWVAIDELAIQHGLWRLWLRLPMIVFSLWLGSALWWVSRRLYNNAGGYVALGIYCTSPAILVASARINAEILAAWGLFGAIYTSIGVAHALYAPPAKWRVRIVLLGLAFGFTAAAHLTATFVALALGAFFMLYLAPGRRVPSLAILLMSSAIGAALLWALYGLGTDIRVLDVASAVRIRFSGAALGELATRGNLALLLLLGISLIVFILWRRTRYFGNWSALLVLAVLTGLAASSGHPQIWLLPFAFVFIGGIFADLFETRGGDFAVTALLALIVVQEVCALIMLAGA